MKHDLRLWQIATAFLWLAFSAQSYSSENALDLSLPASRYYKDDAKSFLVAENAETVDKVKNLIVSPPPVSEFEPKLITGKKIHKYLGLSTLVLAGLTTFSAPEDGCENHNCSQQPRPVNGTHAELAKATAVMAIATVVSGLIVHWDDFNWEDGWKDPDNQHIVLGVSGATLLAYAVNKSMNVSQGQVSHAGIAELGALAMLVAVKLSW